MIKRDDFVWYKEKKHQVIHIYEGTGYCEIREVSGHTVQLVQPNEIQKENEDQNKNT